MNNTKSALLTEFETPKDKCKKYKTKREREKN
jgi:hypothetical protein